MKWRKWNRIIHRDLGYLFFGMTIIYSLSGIALNHLHHWNPNYSIQREEFQLEKPLSQNSITKETVLRILQKYNEAENLKSYYFPDPQFLKIFFLKGNIVIDLKNQTGIYEKLERRPVFYHVNFLHYNPQKWWTWFSDIFAVALILVAITGLFIIKGKKGITGRGAWITGVGILIPIIYFLF